MRSPVPRLDKLPALLTPEGSRSSGDTLLQSHSHNHNATATAPNTEPSRSSSSSARHDSRDRRTPPRSPVQARHHGKAVVVPALTPLSTIFAAPATTGPHPSSKKGHTQNDRIKALLRDRAAARGTGKGDANSSASPEPSQLAIGDTQAVAVGGDLHAQSPAAVGARPASLSPEPSYAVGLDARLLPPSVTDEEILRAFRYFAGGHDRDSFNEEQLLDRTAHFYPGVVSKDARLLMGHGAMTADKMRKLIRSALHRDHGEFDAVAEAFKILDPRGNGQADVDILANLLAQLPGVHKLSSEDRAFLLKISDIDGDGVISEADFRRCSTFLPPTPQDLEVAQDASTC